MKANHKVEQYFHLSPKCHAEKVKKNTWRITNAGKKIELVVDYKLSCRVESGSENPICGWFSDAYDHKVQINTLVCDGSFDGNQSFTTHIRTMC